MCRADTLVRLTSSATRLRGIFRILCGGRWDGDRGARGLAWLRWGLLPGGLGDEVGDDEINLVLGVGVDASRATVRTYLIDTTVGGASGLYLHAPQTVVPAPDEVETFASPKAWRLRSPDMLPCS
jgi:hypothetical protein